jgi:glycosyltransferase involved in cell wall biosynthesis
MPLHRSKHAIDDRPLRMAIDVRPLAGSPCGYTVYLCSVLACLRETDIELTLVSNSEIMPHYEEAVGLETLVIGRSGDLKWEQKDLPAFLAIRDFDVYFSGANRGIPIRKNSSTQYVLGLLDIIPYIFFRAYFLREWQLRVRKPFLNKEAAAQLIAIMRADSILTISQQSVTDIKRVFHRKKVESHLIRLRNVDSIKSNQTKRHFVYVGGVDIRKKVDVLLRGFASFRNIHPDFRLVLIGSNYAACAALISELGLIDHVELTGYVDHDTKFRIMSESQAMVYPSLYEGYGLAIAEGFQAGIPVIAGPGGSQAEIGGDGVRYINPSSSEDVAAAMAEMLDPVVRRTWIERGKAQLEVLTNPAIEDGLLTYFREQGRIARERCSA